MKQYEAERDKLIARITRGRAEEFCTSDEKKEINDVRQHYERKIAETEGASTILDELGDADGPQHLNSLESATAPPDSQIFSALNELSSAPPRDLLKAADALLKMLPNGWPDCSDAALAARLLQESIKRLSRGNRCGPLLLALADLRQPSAVSIFLQFADAYDSQAREAARQGLYNLTTCSAADFNAIPDKERMFLLRRFAELKSHSEYGYTCADLLRLLSKNSQSSETTSKVISQLLNYHSLKADEVIERLFSIDPNWNKSSVAKTWMLETVESACRLPDLHKNKLRLIEVIDPNFKESDVWKSAVSRNIGFLFHWNLSVVESSRKALSALDWPPKDADDQEFYDIVHSGSFNARDGIARIYTKRLGRLIEFLSNIAPTEVYPDTEISSVYSSFASITGALVSRIHELDESALLAAVSLTPPKFTVKSQIGETRKWEYGISGDMEEVTVPVWGNFRPVYMTPVQTIADAAGKELDRRTQQNKLP